MADALAVVVASAALFVVNGTAGVAAWTAVTVPLWLLAAKLHGLYDRDHRALRHLTVDEIPSLCMWGLTGTALAAIVLLLAPTGSLGAASAVTVFAVATVAAFALRALARSLWRLTTPRERAAILGNDTVSAAARRKIELFPDIHIDVVAVVPEAVDGDAAVWPDDVDRIIIASQTIDDALVGDLVDHCRRHRIKLSLVPPVRGMFGAAAQLSHVADLPVIEYNTWPVSRSTLLLKRILDVAVSGTLLVLAIPLVIPIALAIVLDSRGPILFSQLRAGERGRPFRMWKFRTMVRDAEQRLADVVDLDSLRDPMFKLTRDPRVTRVGRFLRRTSLDEIPQLWNVLKGDMSLVGPRPEQVELVARYDEDHLFRIAVKPGLTGPMQVYGRGELTFDERLAVEREYVENLSLVRDLRLLAMTIVPVFSGRGAF
jgi:exopolysaccharide biosynthesis polyprenyl glycosylphosphotransferase